MNATDYRNIASEQLSDEDFYEYERRSAQAWDKYTNFIGYFMTSTGTVITDQEEYYHYLLASILEDLGAEVN